MSVLPTCEARNCHAGARVSASVTPYLLSSVVVHVCREHSQSIRGILYAASDSLSRRRGELLPVMSTWVKDRWNADTDALQSFTAAIPLMPDELICASWSEWTVAPDGRRSCRLGLPGAIPVNIVLMENS